MPDMTVKVKYVIAALFCADKVRTINIINETANMIGDIRKAHILLLDFEQTQRFVAFRDPSKDDDFFD